MFVECETQGNILKVKYLGIRILQFTSNLSFYQRSQASGSLQQYSWDPSIRSACTILANLIIAISPVLSNIFRCGKKHLAHITRLQYDQHLITYFSKQLLIFSYFLGYFGRVSRMPGSQTYATGPRPAITTFLSEFRVKLG